MKGQRVGADDQEANVMADERLQQIDKVWFIGKLASPSPQLHLSRHTCRTLDAGMECQYSMSCLSLRLPTQIAGHDATA